MLTARTVSISLATTRSALAHYHPKTRSGAIFSPFKTVDIGCVIDSFIETAVCAETAHEEEEDDDDDDEAQISTTTFFAFIRIMTIDKNIYILIYKMNF